MSKRRRFLWLCALLLTAALMWLLLLPGDAAPHALDTGHDRQLLRIWSVSGIGGSDSWLKKQLQRFEKTHPGVMTYLRTVSPAQLTDPDAVLPDLVLYTPGTLKAPQDVFIPISGVEHLRESLLRSGRWQGQQYGVPLCWGAYVLCVDSAIEPFAAVTPAPTTLLGKPAATPGASAAPQPYPYDAVLAADTPLLAPSGCGTFALCCLLEPGRRPVLPEGIHTTADVYTRFRSRQCASAVLTTGQLIAFDALTVSGKGFACRTLVPAEIITDQVLMASMVKGAKNTSAAELLAFLTGTEAQQALISQGLHTARSDLILYSAGVEGQVEASARRSLTAINAYVPTENVSTSAWQVYNRQTGLSEALLPLL